MSLLDRRVKECEEVFPHRADVLEHSSATK
jgi:hypothetical protein